jgi:hypothetical protein
MKKIGVSVPSISLGQQRLFDALSEVFAIQFERRDFQDGEGIDAWVFPDVDLDFCSHIDRIERPSFAVVRTDLLLPGSKSTSIEFSNDPALPAELRRRQIETEEAGELNVLPPWMGNRTVLASKSGNSIWAFRAFTSYDQHYVSLPIPELNDGEPLFQYFHGRQFLRLLPFFLFLRALTEDRRWEAPPLQACFMFDDPNLHWPTYGYLDFNKIWVHAQEHRYHVSFATIPRDAWLVHPPTAALFRQHRDHLSLLIHGNDHIRDELARPFLAQERRRLLVEALGRIAQLERRAAVEVSRVMAPPHGACSEEVLTEMGRLGFEAACISRGSLRFHNPQASWLRALGMRPADQIGGLTIIPRFPFSGSCQNSILVAALLGQPIIPMGHHTSVARGLGLLEELSEFIHSLGTVRWADMKSISRAHYAKKIDGKRLHLKLYTNRVVTRVAEGVDQIWIERFWPEGLNPRNLGWRIAGEKPEWRFQRSDEPIPVIPGRQVEIVTDPRMLNPIPSKSQGKPHIWPILRRPLAEVRDRAAPVWRRLWGRQTWE